MNIHLKDWYWSSNTLATWYEELTHLKRPWCWERLKVGEGDDRGWDGWMASLTQWTWVWVGSGSWWWTGRPCVLQSMGSHRVGHDWATELNFTDTMPWGPLGEFHCVSPWRTLQQKVQSFLPLWHHSACWGLPAENNQSPLLTPKHPCQGRCSSSHLLCQGLSQPPDLDPELQPQRAAQLIPNNCTPFLVQL